MDCIKNSKIIRKQNKNLILKTIYNQQEVSRSSLANITGLTKGTITTITRELIEENIIFEFQEGESSGGRKPILLKLSNKLGYSIVISFSVFKFDLKVFDLKKNCIFETFIKIDNKDPDHYIALLLNEYENIIKKLPKSIYGIIGVAVVVKGEVDSEGIIRFIPKLGWRNIDLKSKLNKIIKAPIFVDKNSNFFAAIEKNNNSDISEMVFISIDEVFSTGVISENELLRGHLNLASSLGHHVVKFDGIQCECGRIGCLEQYCSELALLRELNLKQNVNSMEEFYDLIEKKDSYALEVLNNFLNILAIGITNIIFILNPELIILRSKIFEKFPVLFKEIESKLILPITKTQKISLCKINDEDFFKGVSNIVDIEFLKYISKSLT